MWHFVYTNKFVLLLLQIQMCHEKWILATNAHNETNFKIPGYFFVYLFSPFGSANMLRLTNNIYCFGNCKSAWQIIWEPHIELTSQICEL